MQVAPLPANLAAYIVEPLRAGQMVEPLAKEIGGMPEICLQTYRRVAVWSGPGELVALIPIGDDRS